MKLLPVYLALQQETYRRSVDHLDSIRFNLVSEIGQEIGQVVHGATKRETQKLEGTLLAQLELLKVGSVSVVCLRKRKVLLIILHRVSLRWTGGKKAELGSSPTTKYSSGVILIRLMVRVSTTVPFFPIAFLRSCSESNRTIASPEKEPSLRYSMSSLSLATGMTCPKNST